MVRGRLLAERAGSTVVLLFVVALVVFFAMRLLPGDPVDIILGNSGSASASQVQALRASLHLDEPLGQQVLLFVSGLFHGDLGESITYREPVTAVILSRVPATGELALAAVVFALIVAVPIGVLSATWRNSILDRLAMTASFVGIAMPGFWLGIVLIMVFAARLRWLPVEGRAASGVLPLGPTGFFTLDALLARNLPLFWSSLRYLVLPAITMGAVMMAILARVIRSSMVEELGKEYVTVARAKGAGRRRVVVRHALRNALIPAVTVFGLELGTLLGGNMIVETVFSWPGLGRLAVDAIFKRDYPLVQGVVIVYACTFAVANLAVDMAYTWLNPRVEG